MIIAFLSILVIVTGGFVRINDAGESCPDWPKCFGSWSFDISESEQAEYWEENPEETDSRGSNHRYSTFEIFTEWFHRLLVGIILLPICLYNVYKVKNSKIELSPEVHLMSLVVFLLLIIQAIAGAITVFFDNADWSVSLHLTLALLFISAALYQSLVWSKDLDKLPKNMYLTQKIVTKVDNLLRIMTTSLFALLFIGAWLATAEWGSYASACSIGWMEGWPLCQGKLIPDFEIKGTHIQMLHRIVALLVGIFLSYGAYRVYVICDKDAKIISRLVLGGLILVFLNGLIGGCYVIFAGSNGFPEYLSLLHLICGSLALIGFILAVLIVKISHDRVIEQE
jgi:heme A synthase